ncbi:MAG: hypothetical protein R6W91_04530, partial [Thermoplasmata archaeon]
SKGAITSRFSLSMPNTTICRPFKSKGILVRPQKAASAEGTMNLVKSPLAVPTIEAAVSGLPATERN